MRIVSEQNRIAQAIRQLNLSTEFDTDSLRFEIRIYEKGEQIVSPLNPLDHFVFVISGSIRVYQLDEDGIIHSLINIRRRDCLGYNEFCFNNNKYTLYAEAFMQTVCLVLPFHQPAGNLKSDCDFLLFLLRNSLLSQIQNSEITHFCSDLEDKLLFYMENICTDCTLTSVNEAVDALHCSRRQLQRTLKKLCDDQKLVHIKRGCYQIKFCI
jgi:CRP-like cAMP-binding protein